MPRDVNPYRVSDAIELGCAYKAQIVHLLRQGFQGGSGLWETKLGNVVSKEKIKSLFKSMLREGYLSVSRPESNRSYIYVIEREELK